ncbi:MAG: alanine racemase [Phycisphaerales bacterium]
MATSRIEIDLSAVGRNLAVMREVVEAGRSRAAHAPGRTPVHVSICGVIKQDAYGLGAVRIAKKLTAHGIEMLAVYCTDEARALVDVPGETPVLVLMPVRRIERADPVYRLAVRDRLHLVVHDIEQARQLAECAAQLGVRLSVHVQLDTGMARGGALAAEATDLVMFIMASQRLRLAGVMTHFSSPASDEAYTREQAKMFRAWYESVRPMFSGPVMVHAANTAAALRSSSLHAGMVRIGQGFWGFGAESIAGSGASSAVSGASGAEFAAQGARLEPVMRWVSRIVHIHEVPAGSPVGYGRTFVTERPTRVALVPVGYADGYPVSLSNVGKIALTGRSWDRPKSQALHHTETHERPAFVPVIGRVSMDQITVDVTGLPERLAHVGGEVELIGRDALAPNHLPTLAAEAGTITHEMLCRLCPQIERQYTAGAATEGSQGPITLSRAAGVVAVRGIA